MLECCGAPCPTPFCPACGKAVLDGHPLAGLLDYCRDQQTRYEAKARRATATAEELRALAGEPVRIECKQEDALRAEVKAVLWKEWTRSLERVLGLKPPAPAKEV